MNQKMYFLSCGTVFFVVAAAHLARLIFGWEIAIAGWTIPHWISIPGFIVPGVLSVWGFVLASRAKATAG
jgi:hypothetical protein